MERCGQASDVAAAGRGSNSRKSLGFLRHLVRNEIATSWAACFCARTMPFITSAQPGQSSALRPETQQGKKPTFRATQTLARQKSLERKAKKYGLPLGELAIFTQQLASLLTAGLPLVQSLEALQDQTEDQVFCVVIREVKQDISSGNSFSSSVKKFPRSFPPLFISMVEAGEASGALSEILAKVAVYFEASV